MNEDIKSRHGVRIARVGRPSGPPRRRMRIDFSVPEAVALKRYKLNQGEGTTYRTVLVDGLQLLPGFSDILEQETTKYATQQREETYVHPDAKRIEEELGR